MFHERLTHSLHCSEFVELTLNRDDDTNNNNLIFPANDTRKDNATHVLSIDLTPTEGSGNINTLPTVVNGLTIAGGHADGQNETGGGIYIYGDNSQGGIFNIERCFLFNNYAQKGGAIYVEENVKNISGTSLINQCVIYNNAAGERSTVENAGGGVYIKGEATVVNSSIFNNENGGLILSQTSTVVNSTVARNTSGGIDMITLPNINDFNVYNTIIWGNSTLAALNKPNFKNSAFHEVEEDNNPDKNIYVTTENRGDQDAPMFDAPSLKTSFDRDFDWKQTAYPLWSWNVLEGSVMHGKGDTQYYQSNIFGEEDMAGNARQNGSSIDIGAYQFQPLAEGRIRYVKEGGKGDGSSWENASGDLQKMIDDLAQNNPQDLPGEVWVAQGDYIPKTQIINGTTYSASFLMREGISVYGGFNGDEDSKQDRKTGKMPWQFNNETVLQGVLYNNDNTSWNATNHKWELTSDSRHVVFFAPLPSENKPGFNRATTLNGVTIQGGYAQGDKGVNEFLTDRGAGVYMGINAILEKCIVTENSATGNGGGVYLHGGRILNSLIYNNNADGDGGAVYMDNAGLILASMLTNNSADNGAGAYMAHTGSWTDGKLHPEYLILSTSVVSNNTSRLNGAIYCAKGGVLLQNTITNNDCPTATDNTSGNASQTGGLYIDTYGLVVNSVLWNNTIQQLNIPVYAKNPTTAKVRFLYNALSGMNNSIWNNILQKEMIALVEENESAKEGVLSPDFSEGWPSSTGVTGSKEKTSYFWEPIKGGNLRARGMTLGTLPGEVVVAPEIDIAGKRFAQKPAIGAYAVELINITPEETSDAFKLYVDINCAVATHNGSSWEYGYRSLNEAIAYLANLEKPGNKRLEIHVLEGDIWPRYAFTNLDPKTATITVPVTKSGQPIEIYGGYHRTTDNNTVVRDPLTYRSIINGNTEAKDIKEGLYHCITVQQGAKLVLDGFHVINGYAAGEASRQYGAGLLAHAGSEVTVRNCIFENNTAQEGAAIDAREATLTLQNCVVNNNTNTNKDAGKPVVNAKSLKMEHVTIVNNVGAAPENTNDLYATSFSAGNSSNNTQTLVSTGEAGAANFANPTNAAGATLGFDTYLGGYTSFMPTNQCEVVNKGTTSGLTEDITGGPRSRGGAPDLGAYEAELPVDGTVIYVRAIDGNDNNKGLTWGAAKKTITAALNAVTPTTKEVWVAAGTYNERITLRDGIQLYGGFAKTGNPDNVLDGTNRDISNANPDFMTIIDGQNGGRVVTQSGDFTILTTVEGFVIQNGNSRGSDANSNGAGVKLMSNGKLKNCLVQNNTHINTYNSWRDDPKYIGGGGISMSAGSVVDGCIIKGNKANKENNDRYTCGAGIHMNGGTLINSIIVDNMATSTSGSGWLDWGSNILGAAVFIQTAGTFYNCTFAYNYGNTNGKSAVVGGVWDDSKNSKFYNCIFWGNAGNGTGGENTIQVGGPGYSDGGTESAANKNLINCYASIAESSQTTAELWGNPDATFQMNIGSSDYNQMISKAKANQPFDANYKLINNATGIHCINKGENSYVEENNIYLDAAGATRIQYCTVDKGAYESTDAIQIEPDASGVFYVTQGGAGTSNASSVDNASCAMELQRVLNTAGERAKSGQTAIVKIAGYEGATFIYRANTLSDEKDPQSYTFVIPYGVTVMGGYKDNDTDWSEENRNPERYKTVLSAIAQKDIQDINGYHVVTFGEPTGGQSGKTTIIDGLYLRQGKATSMAGEGNPNTRGGGAIVPAWAHVRNCVVEQCEAVQGGGLYVMPGGRVSGSLIMKNTAEEGAGIYADGNGVDETNRGHMVSCTITDNEASSTGGGLFLEDGAMMTLNSVIWGNKAPSDKNVSGVLTETYPDAVWSKIESNITEFYPINHSFVETYEMPSNFENTAMESDEELYFASTSRTLKAYSPLIKHGMDVSYQDALNTELDIAPKDMQGILRKQDDMKRIDGGAYAFLGGSIPTDILLTRIFVSQGANVQLPAGEDMNKYIGRSFYTSLTWLDDALEYIRAVRANGKAKADTEFEILLAGGTYKPSYRRTGAATTTIDQRQNSYDIPQGVHIYGGFKGDELISSKAGDENDLTQIPGMNKPLVCMGDIKEILNERKSSDFNQNGIEEPWELENQVILSGHVNVSDNVKNVYHVLYSEAGQSQPVNPVVLDGLTVMDGETASELSNSKDQDEIGRGGGLYTNGVPYIINRCRFVNNFGIRGGAIYSRDADLSVIGSIFAGNGTVEGELELKGQDVRGGAVYLAGINKTSKLKAINTLWANNATSGNGGAIGTSMTNDVIADQQITVDLMNNTFVRNKAQNYSVAYIQDGSQIVNTVMWGNEGQDLLSIPNGISYSASEAVLPADNNNILLSTDNMSVTGPRFEKPSETAGVKGNDATNLWNPGAISVLTDAGDGKEAAKDGSITGKYDEWWVNNNLSAYKDQYINNYKRYAGPLNEDGTQADKPIDIGLYEYQYKLAFGDMDKIYVATEESGNGDGTNWSNATSDLRGALIAMANPTGGNSREKEVHIKTGEYSLPNLSAGTAYTIAMSTNKNFGTSLKVYGSYNASGVQDYSQPTVITTHEQSQNTTDKLISVNTGAKPVTIDGLTFINKRANGGIGMEAVTEAGGKLTLTHTAFRKNDGGAMTLKNDGETLIANALFADSKGTGLTVTSNVGNVTVVNATFANNGTDMTKELTKVYNTVAWGNMTQSLPTTEGQNNANIANGIKNDDIQQGPNFVDPANADVLQRDYNIYPSLTLLNKGNNNNYTTNVGVATMDNEKDLGGHARQVETIDIGAYEYTARLQPVVYVKDNVVGSNGSGDSWANAIAGQSLQGAVNLAGIYAADKKDETGTVFVHSNVKNSTTLTLSMARTKVYGSMNDETGANASEILGKRQGILTTDNRSILEGGLTLTAGATGSVVDGFEVSGTVNIEGGMLATSIVKNEVATTGDGMIYNSLVEGNVNGKAVNVTATGEISEGGNNRASVSETNSYVTDNYWNYQLMETSADIDPTGTRTDINDYIKQVGHNRDLAGNLRIRNTVDNGCFETWNISSDYIITADDYPVGKSVVYVRKGQELSIKPDVYPNGKAFNPGFLLLEHKAGLRSNNNYINLTGNFAVEREIQKGDADMAVMPFKVKEMTGQEGLTFMRYNGNIRAAYDYTFDATKGKAWEELTQQPTNLTEGFLIENGSDAIKTVRFWGESYSEDGNPKVIKLMKYNFNEPWNSESSVGNRFTHQENMSWNLFGSPYLCAMNYSDLQYGRVLYGYENEYKTVNTANTTVEGHIPAGSAVFTQTATLKDAESINIAQPTGSKSGDAFANMTSLRLAISPVSSTRTTDDEEIVADVLQLNTVESSEARTEFDMGADGVKWMAENTPQIYAEQNGGRYSLLSAVDKEGSVQIGLSVPQTGMYSLYIPADCDAYDYETVVLEDKLTGTVTDLKAGAYTFNAPQAGDLNDRFQLYFNRSVDEAESNIRVVSATAGQARVLGIQPGDVIRVYNTQGMLVEQRKADTTEATFSLPRGIHLFKVTTADDEVVKKAAVR